MITLEGDRIAEVTGARVTREGPKGGPARALVDSRQVQAGDLFVGMAGDRVDGGEFAAAALESGAWGVLVSAERARELGGAPGGWVLGVEDPLTALQSLARAWRRDLGARVVGITGSTGKTSVKDICRALVAECVHASPENYNTEVGLPLAILGAPLDAEVLVLEMAMRGPGQIAELAAIAEPDIGAVINVGPVHLELLGRVENVAAAKAELLDAVADGGTAIVPAEAGPLAPHLKPGRRTVSFGTGGDVDASEVAVSEGATDAVITTPAGEGRFRFPFAEAYNLTNALAAIAVGTALGTPLGEMASRASRIVFSRLRGELVDLGDGSVLINDCYNANPMSMRAALAHLGSLPAEGRRIAVLGEMGELGAEAEAFHREVGEVARESGAELVIGVGELASGYEPDQLAGSAEEAAALLADLVGPGDVVLVKGSRAVGLEVVAERLRDEDDS